MTHADKRFCKCIYCREAWNVSKFQRVPWTGYVCPGCAAKDKKFRGGTNK
jgi:hypothetical protein